MNRLSLYFKSHGLDGAGRRCFLLDALVTAREETEWVETVKAGGNVLAGCEPVRIVEAAQNTKPAAERMSPYGEGRAAERIVRLLASLRSNAQGQGGGLH